MKVCHIYGPYPYRTNTFVCIGEEGAAAVIDPAAKAQEYYDVLTENDAQLKYILLTHGHHDHIASVEQLRRDTGAQLVMSAEDAQLFGMKPDKTYTDGEDIKLDDMTFHVIKTPGHTPGSACLVCGDLMFAGDTLFAGDIGRCDLEGGDYSVMQQSLKKLCQEVTTNVQVLPGHGEFSTMDEEKANNRYLQ